MGPERAAPPVPGTGDGHPLRLHAKGITKTFGRLVANDSVELQLARGEVHGVLGENGAGKSTLVNILSGLYQPDRGELFVDGEPARLSSPRQARVLGIGTVHQHFMLAPALSVGDNIRLPSVASVRTWWRRGRHSDDAIADFATRTGFALPPLTSRVGELPLSLQQRVEIVRALYFGATTLIMDEPTAVLTPDEATGLLRQLRSLATEGVAVVFISHKLHEVAMVCDRVTVLRRGRVVARRAVTPETIAELPELMVGGALPAERAVTTLVDDGAEPVLEATNVVVRDDRDQAVVDDVSLTVRAGEIVGVAAVEGNGQRELAEAIYGTRPVVSGILRLQGRDLDGLTVAARQSLGLRAVPEDRHEEGLILDFSIAENLLLEDESFHRRWLRPLRQGALRTRADRVIAQYDIRASSSAVRVRQLSGGNQQKLVLGRALSHAPRVLIASHPFRGLDVGATAYIRDMLLAERERGTAVLLICPDLDDVLALSDTVVVMLGGKIVRTLPKAQAEKQLVARLMLEGRGEQ